MLYLANLPYNCKEHELKEWIETRGIETRSVRIIRDLVSGVSPAFGYVELRDHTRLNEAITILNGKKIRNQAIVAEEARNHPLGAARAST